MLQKFLDWFAIGTVVSILLSGFAVFMWSIIVYPDWQLFVLYIRLFGLYIIGACIAVLALARVLEIIER